MTYHEYLSPKLLSKCMGYTKRNKKIHIQRRYATCPQGMSKKKRKEKRYIPKEGKPHAPKACQKKRENIAHTKNIQGREKSYKGVSSIIHQKYPHTCTS